MMTSHYWPHLSVCLRSVWVIPVMAAVTERRKVVIPRDLCRGSTRTLNADAASDL